MALYRTLRVASILEEREGLLKLRLDNDSRAYCYTNLTGTVRPGDEVVVNTTAVDLGLGTGGWHFVLWNLANKALDTPRGGHIMKMRYAPGQTDTGAAEEFDDFPREETSVQGMPVIAAPLHSHIPAITSFLKSTRPDIHIAVAISDGAALPLVMSDLITELREKELVDSTISFGHAFGGDIETINVYTALIAAKHISHADVAIVSMGPGIVGTNSAFGFTGIEVATHLDAAHSLEASTFGVLRASDADPRKRHQGISHHSITTFSQATHERHNLGVIIDHERSSHMMQQLSDAGISKKHSVTELSSCGIVDIMETFGLRVTSMGRTAREDELFFEMAAASAQLVDRTLGA